jgi:hypothetical protein
MADEFLSGAAHAVARALQVTAAPAVPAHATTTVTTTDTVIENVGEEVDQFAHVLTRIMDIMFFATLLGICGVAYKFRYRIWDEVCAPISLRPGRLLRMSDCLKCLQIATFDCCGICRCLGYDSITAPSRTLTITLVGMYNCKKAKEIYCQFSTDEINMRGSHSEVVKSSRVHRVDSSGFADMKGEKLDFDWYGDEHGIFGLVRSYGVLTRYEYQPVIGSIFVPYAQIKEFAREVRENRHMKNGGARQFVVKPVAWKPPDPKGRHALDEVQGGLMKTVMEMTKPAVSVEQRLNDLEFENENLKRQIRGEPPLDMPIVNDPNQDPSNFPSLVMMIEVKDYSHAQVASANVADYPAAPDPQIDTWKSLTGSGYTSMAQQ